MNTEDETNPVTTLEVRDLTVLTFQPGDVLLVRASGLLSAEQAEHIREAVAAAIPDGTRVLVAERDVDVAVLRFAKDIPS